MTQQKEVSMSDSKIKFVVKESDRNSLVAGADNIFAKIGTANNGDTTTSKVEKVTSASYAEKLYGKDSSLHKSCLLHFALGGSTLYCVRLEGNELNTGSLINALKAVKDDESAKEVRIIHIVDPIIDSSIPKIDTSFFKTLDTKIKEMRQSKRWVRAIASVDKVESKDNIDKLKDLAGLDSKNIALFYQDVKSKTLNETTSVANHALATLSRAKVQESIGWTGAFPQDDVISIEDWDSVIRDNHSALTDKNFNSLYYEDGEAAGKYPFFGIGLLKAPPKSDFRKISSGRVMDKALRVIHNAVFPFLRSNQGSSKLVAGSKAGILNLKLKMETALDGMMGRDEINGYEIDIPAIDNPNTTVADLAELIIKGKLEGTFKLYENSHIESMTFDAMYAMPKLS